MMELPVDGLWMGFKWRMSTQLPIVGNIRSSLRRERHLQQRLGMLCHLAYLRGQKHGASRATAWLHEPRLLPVIQ